MKKFEEINQSDTAQRKLKNIAQNSNLPEDFVSVLFNLHWDFDPIGKEAIGWVKNEQISKKQLEKDVAILMQFLNIDHSVFLNKKIIANKVASARNKTASSDLVEKLLIAAEHKNYAYLSEYATYHYINNFSLEKLINLAPKESYSESDFAFYLFCKVFRGGAVERGNLFYCYTDLCFDLPYQKQLKAKNNWIDELTQKINSLEKSTLSDLVVACKDIVSGDKRFKQQVLQALSYSGKVKVRDIDVSNIFIPDFMNELSKHYYANEWTYPLRMWNEK